MAQSVKIYITPDDYEVAREAAARTFVSTGKEPSHRDFVRHKFREKGYEVINYEELRYFYPDMTSSEPIVVEGVVGKSILKE